VPKGETKGKKVTLKDVDRMSLEEFRDYIAQVETKKCTMKAEATRVRELELLKRLLKLRTTSNPIPLNDAIQVERMKEQKFRIYNDRIPAIVHELTKPL